MGFFFACCRKCSTVRPSIYGTAATFTTDRFTNCKVSKYCAYLFSTSGNLLQEEDVDCVQLRQVCLTLLSEEVVDVLLRGHLLHDLFDVHLLQSRCLLVMLHLSLTRLLELT